LRFNGKKLVNKKIKNITRFYLILLTISIFPHSQIFPQTSHVNPDNVKLIADKNTMQCMTTCIKHEGNSTTAKRTCKLRCTNIQTPSFSSGEKIDCMSIYKKCRKSCPKKTKPCRKLCKKNLTSCI